MRKIHKAFEIAPPRQTVSQPKPVFDQASDYKNPRIITFIKQLSKECKYYREVRGDGNCFFRSVAISYLSTFKHKSIQQAFPGYSEINLCVSPDKFIPIQILPYYYPERLKSIFETGWAQYFPAFLQKNSTYQAAVCELVNTHLIMDVLIILYLRAKCLQTLQQKQSQIKSFLIGDQLKIICEYGEQSSNSVIYLMGQALGIGIKLKGFDRNTLYDEEFPFEQGKVLELFFRPGHYDVFASENQYQAQMIDSNDISTVETTQTQCQVCPFMTQKKCFRCEMREINCPVFNKVMSIPLQQPDLVRKTQSLPEHCESPKKVHAEVKKSAPILCIECNSGLSSEQELQTLVCRSCIHEVRQQEKFQQSRIKNYMKPSSYPINNRLLPYSRIASYQGQYQSFAGRR